MPQIEAAGARLAAICPQRPEFLKKMKQKHNLSFPILRDYGNEVAAKFGLYHVVPPYLQEIYSSFSIDLPRFNGEDSWSLAMPARYVIARDGTIVSADFDPDHTHRPEPEKTVRDLE
jgi:peroxiredoxin